MNHNELRKRGWSIHSEVSEHTVSSEQELTKAEKRKLLENFPKQSFDEEDGVVYENDDIHESKKARVQEEEDEISFNNDSKPKVAPELLTHAKAKLSKWAARLFDPDRPRGLIEPPQIIPLNDEFLTAFGKREKLFDEKLGRTMAIDKDKIVNEDGDGDGDDISEKYSSKDAKKDLQGRKLKIGNLPYSLTEETLLGACSAFGAVEVVNLIMDKEKPTLNAGRAYVTFEQPTDAVACMEKMTKLQGRTLRINMAESAPKSKSTNQTLDSRYYTKDITTKCFRCGEVGHIEANCPNPAKQKPCPLCGQLDHDYRECKLSKICFRCNRPGHINRDCPEIRPLPKPMICGICFGSGHHRVSCRRGPYDAPSIPQAKCMVCGSVGHFMCQDMKWFFGLEGVSCFNCGRDGHHGYDCQRPKFDACVRDEDVAKEELERQQAIQLSEDFRKEQNRSRDFGRRGDRNIYRPRAKSQPPPQQQRGYARNSDGRGYPRNGGGQGYTNSTDNYARTNTQRRGYDNRGYSNVRRR